MKINYIKRFRKNIISIKEGNSSWKNLEGKRASLITWIWGKFMNENRLEQSSEKILKNYLL